MYNRAYSDFEIECWQEDARRKEEKDERKRKYNVKWNDEVFVFSKCLPACFPLIKTNSSICTPIPLLNQTNYFV